MATTRATFGNILGSVSNAASTISNTLDAANQGIGMLNTFIGDMAQKQQLRSKADMEEYAHVLADEKAMEDATRRIGIAKFRETSEQHEALFTEAHDRYKKILGITKD